jgi:uncharacterized membrane protein HdeD (DUF308 family)
MRRGTLAWFRYRMISGILFSIIGLIIAGELVQRPGALQNKIAGFGFAVAVIALGIVRIVHYLQARKRPGAPPA